MEHQKSLGAALADSCSRHADKIALMSKTSGEYTGITFRELQNSAFAVADELLKFGIEKEDRIAVLSANRPEWAIIDFACQVIGAVLVPIYTSLSGAQVQYILQDSGSVILFAENEEQAEKAEEMKSTGELKKIWLFDAGKSTDSGFEDFTFFLQEAKKGEVEEWANVKERMVTIGRDDLATLIYTSGTTGLPKGVMLTHGNLLSNHESISTVITCGPEDSALSLLPLAHVFERLAGHFHMLLSGVTIAYAESPLTVAQNLLEVKPTLMLAVPRFYEKMKARILNAVQAGPFVKRRIFSWALKTGKKTLKKTGDPSSSFRYRLADKLVFSKLKERTGGRLRLFVSGGAPLSADVGEFFHAAGIPILEGYGLTESSPVLTVNRLDDLRFGTVGFPLSNVEIKIEDDGEILARGPNIMKGYLNLPGDTKAALDDQGFLHTGDVGFLDEDGRLVITGRKKELMVTSSGRNIAPSPIENLLKSSPYIGEIMLIADDRQYVTALIVPDFEQLKTEGIGPGDDGSDNETLIGDKQVKRLIEYEVKKLSAGLSAYEHVIKFTLLPREFSIEEGELTPSMKVKRNVVLEKYADLIERMYSENEGGGEDPTCYN